ncbi:hypothetical protein C7212DRAFT_364603 [Tuber magnatum]|uniref:Uncharacterized protein n=1 Tax=Tuber magnatum TaxID=42249 RepID=A0A317SKN5_9PEZI|nr:hypothetical protein C7212DRAFT_364603 [Tuber magnatum]
MQTKWIRASLREQVVRNRLISQSHLILATYSLRDALCQRERCQQSPPSRTLLGPIHSLPVDMASLNSTGKATVSQRSAVAQSLTILDPSHLQTTTHNEPEVEPEAGGQQSPRPIILRFCSRFTYWLQDKSSPESAAIPSRNPTRSSPLTYYSTHRANDQHLPPPQLSSVLLTYILQLTPEVRNRLILNPPRPLSPTSYEEERARAHNERELKRKADWQLAMDCIIRDINGITYFLHSPLLSTLYSVIRWCLQSSLTL